MKQKITNLTLVLFSFVACLFACPAGFRTANAKGDAGGGDDPSEKISADVAALQKQSEDQAKQIEDLKAQLAAKDATPPAPDTGMLGLLCKGAGVDLDDVRWRVQAGLDPEAAVTAAVAQKKFNASKKKEAKK